jgi:hypothetical protein
MALTMQERKQRLVALLADDTDHGSNKDHSAHGTERGHKAHFPHANHSNDSHGHKGHAEGHDAVPLSPSALWNLHLPALGAARTDWS